MSARYFKVQGRVSHMWVFIFSFTKEMLREEKITTAGRRREYSYSKTIFHYSAK